ncbi:hypothetical protein [Corynebacterium sp. NML120713]|uniref:hypothetical protein n=1 Tax=Corynebacterium sp. NML120713 TaxID=1906332 RepID=UPI0011603EA7|nr:hypothetical protein [Corynebacterium sp. NML120713]
MAIAPNPVGDSRRRVATAVHDEGWDGVLWDAATVEVEFVDELLALFRRLHLGCRARHEAPGLTWAVTRNPEDHGFWQSRGVTTR